MSDNSIGVGIAGYGLAAKKFHIPLISAVDSLQLRAIATSRPDVALAETSDVDTVDDIEQLCERDDIDLVVVAGRNPDHFPVASHALMNGKHVVVEKPMTLTTKEADELIAIAQEQNRTLNVFHNRRWDNGTLALERVLDEGTLGDLSLCSLRYDRLVETPTDRWREDGSVGSGMTYDLGSHLFYVALTLFGLPDSLHADIAVQREGGVSDDFFDIALTFGSLRVDLRSSMLVAVADLIIEAHGTRGSFRKFGVDPQAAMLSAGLTPAHADWQTHQGYDYAEIARPTYNDLADVQRIAMKPGTYELFYTGVADAILHDSEPSNTCLRARNVIALIEAAFRSSNEGRRLNRDELGLI